MVKTKHGESKSSKAISSKGAASSFWPVLVFIAVFSGLSYAESIPSPSKVEMTVHVAAGQIRRSPSAVSPILATAAYRQRLTVLGSANGWVKVALPGSPGYGYIYASALSPVAIPQAVAFPPGQDAAPGVSGTEITLAGKGFNAELEQRQVEKEPGLFEWVDFMEGFAYRAEVCVDFLDGKGTQ